MGWCCGQRSPHIELAAISDINYQKIMALSLAASAFAFAPQVHLAPTPQVQVVSMRPSKPALKAHPLAAGQLKQSCMLSRIKAP